MTGTPPPPPAMRPPDLSELPPPTPSNGLGIGGFVTSLIGILACAPLSLVGLILSAVALRKEPRGFAIAGTVIGALGLLLIPVYIAILLPALSAARDSARVIRATTEGMRISMGVQAHEADSGSRVTSLADLPASYWAPTPDPWGGAYWILPANNAEGFVVMASGPDAAQNTDDDVEVYSGTPKP